MLQGPARDLSESGRGGLRGSWQTRGEAENLSPGPRSSVAKLFDAFYLKSRGSPAHRAGNPSCPARPKGAVRGRTPGAARAAPASAPARERRDGEQRQQPRRRELPRLRRGRGGDSRAGDRGGVRGRGGRDGHGVGGGAGRQVACAPLPGWQPERAARAWQCGCGGQVLRSRLRSRVILVSARVHSPRAKCFPWGRCLGKNLKVKVPPVSWSDRSACSSEARPCLPLHSLPLPAQLLVTCYSCLFLEIHFGSCLTAECAETLTSGSRHRNSFESLSLSWRRRGLWWGGVGVAEAALESSNDWSALGWPVLS